MSTEQEEEVKRPIVDKPAKETKEKKKRVVKTKEQRNNELSDIVNTDFKILQNANGIGSLEKKCIERLEENFAKLLKSKKKRQPSRWNQLLSIVSKENPKMLFNDKIALAKKMYEDEKKEKKEKDK